MAVARTVVFIARDWKFAVMISQVLSAASRSESDIALGVKLWFSEVFSCFV